MNIDCLKHFRRGGNVGIHQELARFLTERIETGELPRGGRLPSVRELARLWDTNIFSVRLATDELVTLGLLSKQQGRGMFVTPEAKTIFRVGLYTSRAEALTGDLTYHSMLRDLLGMKLRARGIEYTIFDDCRPADEHTAPPEDLRDAIVANRIQAVIGTLIRSYDEGWFQRLPVRKLSQMFDSECDYSGVARRLAAAGRRRVAAILPSGLGGRESRIATGFREAGIRIRPARLRLAEESESLNRRWGEIGYRLTHELLALSPRPDALIVYPDHAAQGAVQAILKLGIRVPEELTVVFHRNLELSWFCSLEAEFIDVRIADIADRLIENLLR